MTTSTASDQALTGQPKANSGLEFPQVARLSAEQYAKAWKPEGSALEIILDNFAVQFATDFANEVLRQYSLQAYVQNAAQMEHQANEMLRAVEAVRGKIDALLKPKSGLVAPA